MIITDGEILDLQKTTDEIVAASGLPLSIIIIGVGDQDFGAMEKLDADLDPLWSEERNTYQSRDIVQFVPFNKFKGNNTLLAKELLREIPRQMLSYFQSKGIHPNPPNMEVRAQQMQQFAMNFENTYFAMQKEGLISYCA